MDELMIWGRNLWDVFSHSKLRDLLIMKSFFSFLKFNERTRENYTYLYRYALYGPMYHDTYVGRNITYKNSYLCYFSKQLSQY